MRAATHARGARKAQATIIRLGCARNHTRRRARRQVALLTAALARLRQLGEGGPSPRHRRAGADVGRDTQPNSTARSRRLCRAARPGSRYLSRGAHRVPAPVVSTHRPRCTGQGPKTLSGAAADVLGRHLLVVGARIVAVPEDHRFRPRRCVPTLFAPRAPAASIANHPSARWYGSYSAVASPRRKLDEIRVGWPRTPPRSRGAGLRPCVSAARNGARWVEHPCGPGVASSPAATATRPP